MATFSKQLLTNSTNGKQILVTSSVAPGDFIHIASNSSTTIDEVFLYGINNSSIPVTASVLWGNTGSIDTIQTTLPALSGRVQIADGRLLANGLSIRAYSTGNSCSFDGFVNRIIDTPTIDPIVTEWANRVISNGGNTTSASTQAALSTFVQTLNTNGILSLMLSVNCFVPDGLIAATTPLINSAGNNLYTNTSFVSSDLNGHGLKGDASSKYLDTGFTGTSFPSDNNAGMTIYCSQTASAGQYDTGYTSNLGDISFVVTTHAGAAATFMGQIWSTTDVTTGSANLISPSTGSYLSVNRVSSTDLKLYAANSRTPHYVVLSNTTTRTSSRNGTTVYIFAIRAFNSGTLPFGHSNSRMSFFAIHYGLTQAQSQVLFNAVQTLRQTLGGGYV
jgi:hypothetical protein